MYGGRKVELDCDELFKSMEIIDLAEVHCR